METQNTALTAEEWTLDELLTLNKVEFDPYEFEGLNVAMVIVNFKRAARKARWTLNQTQSAIKLAKAKPYAHIFDFIAEFCD